MSSFYEGTCRILLFTKLVNELQESAERYAEEPAECEEAIEDLRMDMLDLVQP